MPNNGRAFFITGLNKLLTCLQELSSCQATSSDKYGYSIIFHLDAQSALVVKNQDLLLFLNYHLFLAVSEMQPGGLYQSSFRSYCSCPHPSCVDDRNTAEHVCRAPLSYQKSSESHLRLQASSLLQMQGDPRLYSKTDRSPFFPSAEFGVISRPSSFYVPSPHCFTGQQLFFPFSAEASQTRQHGKAKRK